jgi:hypothetical protein
VYFSGKQSDLPALVLLHGAGHSALSWGMMTVNMNFYEEIETPFSERNTKIRNEMPDICLRLQRAW